LRELLASPARAAAQELFDNRRTYVTTDRWDEHVPHGWHAKRAMLFDSYREFAAAARHGLPGDVRAVVYDNEHWSRTPRREQQHPGVYAARFAHLAHQLGLTFIAAPSPVGQGRMYEADARHADVLDLQLQGIESDPAAYARRVRQASKHARRINPGVRIVAEISSNPAKVSPNWDGVDTPAALHRTIDSLVGPRAAAVDGIWPWLYQKNAAGRANAEQMVQLLAEHLRAGHGSHHR
jgi:hypothetical protein